MISKLYRKDLKKQDVSESKPGLVQTFCMDSLVKDLSNMNQQFHTSCDPVKVCII